MKLEVRCCCQPQKLLGWLPVPDDVCHGSILKFVVAQKHWVMERQSEEPHFVTADVIRLPVAMFYERDVGLQGWETRKYLALKSEETPLELLRQIRGFEESV